MKVLRRLLLISASVLVLTALPAGATSTSEVSATLGDMSSAMGDVGSAAQRGVSGLPAMKRACQDLEDAASTYMSYSRPRQIPKVSWKHSQKAALYSTLAAEACIDGAENYDVDSIRQANTYMSTVTAELKLATATLK